MLETPLSKTSSSHRVLSAVHTRPGAGVKHDTGLSFRTPPGLLRWRRVRGTSLQWLRVEESGLLMLENGHAANRSKATGSRCNPKDRRRKGRRYRTHRASEEEQWGEDVNRQCHSRNRTRYIYINSLLYNHDKQKHIHTKI